MKTRVNVNESSPQGEKLQKVLAQAGLGSRREMERRIEQGKVKVNGSIARLGNRIKLSDRIEVDNRRVRIEKLKRQRMRVLLYNKREGEICTCSDPEERPTVYDKLPPGRWISVGRLDFNTSGLLLFTNEGQLANKLMHPSSLIDREYLVRIQGMVDDKMKERLRCGIHLANNDVVKFTDIVGEAVGEGTNQWFYCVVMEGRNREVRRLWESQGVLVSRLKRVRYGNIFLPARLRVGRWIELTDVEKKELCITAGIDLPNTKTLSRAQEKNREHHQRRLHSNQQLLSKQKKSTSKYY